MNNPINLDDPSGFWPSWGDIWQGTKKLVNTIKQHIVATVVTAVVACTLVVGINYVRRNPRVLSAATSGGTTIATGKVVEKVSRGGSDAAKNAVNAVRLNSQLTYLEASSVFTESGTLHPDVIRNSESIILGNKLGNPRVIQALTADGSSINSWAKMSTQTFRSPIGNFQVHFYQNLDNGIVSIFEMKVKFSR